MTDLIQNRDRRIAQVLESVTARRSSGERVPDGGVIDLHPELMPELGEQLQALAAVERVRPRQAEDDDVAAWLEENPWHDMNDSLAGYQITREIHRGGQGVVFQAIQDQTKQKVAIKILRHGEFASKGAELRFEREIGLTAKLRHPNIVSMLNCGTTAAGRRFCVMEYVRGQPLNEFVREKNLCLEDSLKAFATVCEAVEFAHRRGVIHRDLKPSNILVDQAGVVKLLDFGLAKELLESADTNSVIMGTPPYMSPEQAGSPHDVDTRTDVYSLGVILYELLTGRFPYPVEGKVYEVLRHIRETAPAPAGRRWSREGGITERRNRRYRSGQCPLDSDIQTIVMKAIDKDPDRRYQSARELGEEIRRYLADEPINAKRDSLLYVLRKYCIRRRAVLERGTIVMLALVAIFGLWHVGVRSKKIKARSLVLNAITMNVNGVREEVMQNRERAIELMRNAIHTDPGYGPAYGNLARYLKDKFKFQPVGRRDVLLLDEAVDHAETAARLQPRNANPLNTKAVCLMLRGRDGDLVRAEESCRAAIARDPGAKAAHSTLSKILFLNGEGEAAATAAARAAEMARSDPYFSADIWLSLAVIQMYRGDQSAIDSIERCLEYNRTLAAAHQVKAMILYRMGSAKNKHGVLRAAIAADECTSVLDPRIKRILALAYLANGEYSRAKAAARHALESEDRLPALDYLIISIAEAETGSRVLATEAFELAEEHYPTTLEAMSYLPSSDLEVLWFDTFEEFEELKLKAETAIEELAGRE